MKYLSGECLDTNVKRGRFQDSWHGIISGSQIIALLSR